jgi:hypothetical protein
VAIASFAQLFRAPASIHALSIARFVEESFGLGDGGIEPELHVLYKLEPAPFPGVTRPFTAV